MKNERNGNRSHEMDRFNFSSTLDSVTSGNPSFLEQNFYEDKPLFMRICDFFRYTVREEVLIELKFMYIRRLWGKVVGDGAHH